MTGTGIERIRARWMAATKAYIRVKVGSEVINVNRDDTTLGFVKTTGAQTPPATTPTPWSDMVGLVWDRGTASGSVTPYHEFVEIDRWESAFIQD